MSSSRNALAEPPHLRRALRLRDLIFFGIVLIQPTAPLPLFGIISQETRGHSVIAILIAMCAMVFTAMSYGRMARAYPTAGSAYTYVGKELHPTLGYLCGWGMLMDYLLNPLISTIWCSKAALNMLPDVPYAVWVVFFAGLFTLLNLRGVQTSARINELLTAALSVVLLIFFAAAFRYLMHGPVAFGQALYNPATFHFPAILTGTSIAALTYIGFDGISTLSEEVENPRRNILIATVLTCVITGVLSSLELYVGQLVWPDYNSFPDRDTAFVHVAGRAGGFLLFQLMNAALLVATIGSGMGSQLAAARLMYGMGRENAIPRGFFGALDPTTAVPRNNVLLIGGVAMLGALLISYQLGAELLNFGAFVAFMGVNASAFRRYWLRSEEKKLTHLVPPLLGMSICFYIWLSLRPVAQIVGITWLAVSLVWRYGSNLRRTGAQPVE